MNGLEVLEETLVAKADRIEDILAYHRNQVRCPVYASVDVRRNKDKAAVVDANAFPAGFNNLAKRSHAYATEAIGSYIRRMYPDAEDILILAEDHTRNRGYFQNLKTLDGLFAGAGFRTALGTLNPELFPRSEVDALDGTVIMEGVLREGDDLVAGNMVPDVVILNNDLATGAPDILDGLRQPVTPPPSMGWHRRRKAHHFDIVHDLAQQIGAYAGLDPWLISAKHERIEHVDFKARQGLDELANHVDSMIEAIQQKYDEYSIEDVPSVFVKADPGTYGMGIMTAQNGDDVRNINSRGREKMDRGKGRVKTTEVLLQEGVPTDVRSKDDVAEPVLYMVCGRVVGGFNRVHSGRGNMDNLNAPGGHFEPLCFTTDGTPGPDEATVDPVSRHIYQVLGEIASIATGYEASRPGQTLPQYP